MQRDVEVEETEETEETEEAAAHHVHGGGGEDEVLDLVGGEEGGGDEAGVAVILGHGARGQDSDLDEEDGEGEQPERGQRHLHQLGGLGLRARQCGGGALLAFAGEVDANRRG